MVGEKHIAKHAVNHIKGQGGSAPISSAADDLAQDVYASGVKRGFAANEPNFVPPTSQAAVPAQAGETGLQKAEDVAEGIGNAGLMAAGLAPMVVPVASGAAKKVASGVEWVAGKSGADGVVSSTQNFKNALDEFPKKSFGEVFGNNSVGRAVGTGAKKLAEGTGNAASGLSDTRFGKWRAERNALAADKHFDTLQKLHSDFSAHRTNIPEELRPQFEKLQNLTRQPIHSLDSQAINAAHAEFVGATNGVKLSKEAKLANKEIEKIVKVANKAAGRFSDSNAWKNLGTAVKSMPQAMANAPVLEGMMNASFVAGSAVGVAGGAMSFSQGLDALKQMATDITGKKVSTFDILTGNVPEIIKQERGHLLKTLAVSESTSGFSLGLALKNAARGVVSPILWFAPMALGMGASMMMDEGALDSYTAMDKAFKSGTPLGTDDYAKLVGIASADLKKRGGIESPFTKAIAEQYATEKASPQLVLQEAANGGVMKRINAIIASNEAAKISEVQTAQAVEEVPQKSHVAALQGRGQHTEQPVIGSHTARLAEHNSMGAAPQLT